jgi:hypothetical protein
MKRVALLDETGVYVGMDTIQDDSQLTALHLPAITECDLTPGAYRWDKARETFVPLPRSSGGRPGDVPSVEEVLLELLDVMPRLLRFPLTPKLARWAEWYGKHTRR